MIADGSTLDVLLRKMGLLRDLDVPPLAGKMMGLLDLASRLPVRMWYGSDAQAHDQTFWPDILKALPKGALLLFDKGFINYTYFVALTKASVFFITRAKRNMKYTLSQTIVCTAQVHDYLIWVGQGKTRQQLRLVEVLYRGKWYRYLTNDLDAERLPWEYVVGLYWQRWRIEDAYAIVKELLGLSYFWSGAQNGIELQVWATWMLYGVLLDLSDMLAEALWRPLADISIEMVFRSLGYFAQAVLGGENTSLIPFLVTHAKLFGLVKRQRKKDTLHLLTEAANP
ncbi:MAG: transposase [Chloroflexi bacterium]|nr:transposase [Chloroflexota bacterium]